MSFGQQSATAGRLHGGFSALLRGEEGHASPVIIIVIAALPIVLLLLKKTLYPTFDPREPPVFRPRVPFVGHLVSMILEGGSFYQRLYDERQMPICTLPILTSKLYVITSPGLIASAMRNKDISFDPFQLEFSSGTLGLTPTMIQKFSADGVLWEVNKIIHESLSGDSVYKMMARALGELASILNGVEADAPLLIPDVYNWLRTKSGVAVMNAFFGENNPLGEDAMDLIWDFDKAIGVMAVAPAPWLFARKGVTVRTKMQELIRPYYEAHHDEGPDCCSLLRRRAAFMRGLGFSDAELGTIEISMPWAAVTNTTVALYWLVVNLFSRPAYVERVRAEVEAITALSSSSEGEGEGGRRVATVDVMAAEKRCPVLMAVYRETLRVYDDNVGNRRATADTTVLDADGREYLLKKGTNIQWTSGLTAMNGGCWGDRLKEYDPERWLKPSSQEEKARRTAFIPFGGGKYLCPGRHFAMAESLGYVAALALGFEVEGAEVARAQNPYPGGAMRQPVKKGVDMSCRIARRKGWEDVEWRFDIAGILA